MCRRVPFIRFVPVLFLLGGFLRADTVEMKETGLKLEGKILRETAEYVVLVMRDEVGQIRIPKDKIKNIEYDIKTQLEKIASDDYAGQFKVGIWAFNKGMIPEAIDLLESLGGKEGVPPERLKLLGRAYEQRQQLDKALERYSDYLKARPDDAEIVARVQALAKEVNPNGSKPGAQPGKPKIVDGLEGDGAWVAENWGNPAKAAITPDPATGNKTVAVVAQAGDKDKAAIARTGQPLNLSDRHEMIFKIFLKSQTPASLSVAFHNSQNEFYESKSHKIVPNSWNTVSIPIDGKDFKAQKSNWQHTLPLEGRERISRITFLIYGQRAFDLYLDSIFFK